jgi:exopolysaccharide biosynthesis protein
MNFQFLHRKFALSHKFVKIIVITVGLLLAICIGYIFYRLYSQNLSLKSESAKNSVATEAANAELTDLKSQDQYKINTGLKNQIDQIHLAFTKSVIVYEKLLDLENPPKDIKGLDGLFANVLTMLANKDYSGATTRLADLSGKIASEEAKLAAANVTIPANLPVSSSAPSSGNYSRQQVQTDVGTFMVDLVAGDLGSTKVIVDTASDGTCANNCPVLPLATYVSRNGAYAGINGSYFCPASYPTCAGKTNSFDLLLMNKNKTYFNSDNNVYSVNPGVIFGGGYIRFVSSVTEWGRDTSIDSMISNYPLLVMGSNIVFGGSSDPKINSSSSRSFVANKGNTVYIGVVHGASTEQVAHVMKSLGMDNALNLDDGGSAAFWYGGYKVGPGRDIPNVILFVKK